MCPTIKNFSDTMFPGFAFDDIYDVAGHQGSTTRGEDHTAIVRKTIGVYLKELGSAKRVGRSEGINVMGAKMTVEFVPPPDNNPQWEVFGLQDGKLPGFLISQRYAPVACRALRTRAVVMDKKDGGPLDTTASDWWVHMVDDLRYVGSHRLRYEEVIQPFRVVGPVIDPIPEDDSPGARLRRYNAAQLEQFDKEVFGDKDAGDDADLFPNLEHCIEGEL
jgi:hypothetical protein